MRVYVIASLDAKEECVQELSKILESVNQNLPSVEGCSSVEIFQDNSDDCKFTLVEGWITESAHNKHIANMIESGDWEHICSLLKSDVITGYYNIL